MRRPGMLAVLVISGSLAPGTFAESAVEKRLVDITDTLALESHDLMVRTEDLVADEYEPLDFESTRALRVIRKFNGAAHELHDVARQLEADIRSSGPRVETTTLPGGDRSIKVTLTPSYVASAHRFRTVFWQCWRRGNTVENALVDASRLAGIRNTWNDRMRLILTELRDELPRLDRFLGTTTARRTKVDLIYSRR